MASIYPARWTRGQILQQGLEKAGNTKIRSLARSQLNRILESIYAQWEWPFLYDRAQVTLSTAGTAALPTTFLKFADEFSCQITPAGPTGRYHPIPLIDLLTMNRIHDGVSQTSIPRYITVEASQTRLIAWPMPVEAIPLELYYKYLPGDVDASDANAPAYDADIPVFPFGMTLALAIEVWALNYDQNVMVAAQRQRDLDGEMDRVRSILIPPKQQPDTIELDPLTFGNPVRPEDWDRW